MKRTLHQHGTQPAPAAGQVSDSVKTAKPVCVFDAGYLSQLEKVLVEFVGPISKVLVKRDSAAAASKEELIARLSSHIDGAPQRKKFEERAAKAQ